MSLEALTRLLPAYARDLSVNLTNLADETLLSEQQKWGTFLSCAYAVGVADVIQHIEAASAAVLSDEAADAARSAAAIMAMNNVYYRSLHLMHNQEYASLRASLRMNVLANPGVPKLDYELWSLAVSAINGCGLCLDSHEKVLRGHGMSNVQVQAALKIAAVVNAISSVIRAENGRIAQIIPQAAQ
ncbi:carboxymuconolactone decarboxylase family protein [Asticcacaulis machinosus]|uniref:Alkyl hydroperoxide reductase AhpD n=1 Tax=Asticcacaulis machinosus TaxID=2984211 RepID=A0ABT5HLD7_9CAUL|nr:carboxymuconolactone decarboxylase family protein [Asticcacaulis machinosus]MDC7677058.1 carboxymuconolactone decarboxylase family protein [Asticcacaulis machinosus]